MNVVDFLTELANDLPNTSMMYESRGVRAEIRKAVETNDSKMLKSLISNKTFYANEVKVTVF